MGDRIYTLSGELCVRIEPLPSSSSFSLGHNTCDFRICSGSAVCGGVTKGTQSSKERKKERKKRVRGIYLFSFFFSHLQCPHTWNSREYGEPKMGDRIYTLSGELCGRIEPLPSSSSFSLGHNICDFMVHGLEVLMLCVCV